MTEASWVAQWDRCTKASPNPGVLRMPTSNRANLPTPREVLPTLIDELILKPSYSSSMYKTACDSDCAGEVGARYVKLREDGWRPRVRMY
jgi:hypothetical protein